MVLRGNNSRYELEIGLSEAATRGMETLGVNCVGTLMELSHFKDFFYLLHSSIKFH